MAVDTPGRLWYYASIAITGSLLMDAEWGDNLLRAVSYIIRQLAL